MFKSIRNFFGGLFRASTISDAGRHIPGFRTLRIEPLEGRKLLTVLTWDPNSSGDWKTRKWLDGGNLSNSVAVTVY